METKDQSSQSGHQPSTTSISNSDSSSGAMRYRSNSHLTEDAATPSPNINEEDQYDYHSIDSTPAEDAEDQIHLSLDEESEEVKQAVLALGAMRRLDLDGSSTASSSPRPKFTSNTSEDAQMDDRSGNDGASLTGSAISSSSAVSSASSTSTPATSQFTSDSGPHHQSRKSTQPPTFTRAQNYAQIHSNSRRGHLGGNSGVGRTGGSFGLQSEEPPSSSASTSTSADDSDFVAGSSTNQTDLDQSTRILKDLPEDFQLPSTIQDENGNEIKIDKEMMKDEAFLRRISHLPIVRSTLRAYEMGKQSSRVVKYGADFVESSVKSISRPVVSRLGASLGDKGVEQLDDFACRQLDRIYPSASMERSISKDEKATIMEELDERSRTDWKDMSSDEISKRRNAYWSLRLEEKEREMVVNELRQRKGKGKERSRADTEMSESSQSSGGRWIQDTTDNDGAGFVGPGGGGGSSSSSKGPGQVVRAADGLRAARSNVSMPGPAANGSRWGSMLVEAGMTAGGLTAAMSEESMKSLKYCLQWLQYATAHIEYQITILRDLIVKLNHGELEISAEATERLNNVKGDVLGTIDNVVKVIGNYAGLALPEQARETVKVFILSIPGRWNAMNQTPTTGPGAAAGARVANFGGSPVSPSFSPAHLSAGLSSSSSSSSGSSHSPIHGSSAQQHRMAAAIAAQGANKILTLAVESLDVLRSVTVVFGESLDRADLWVERLRVLGLQRKRQHEQAALQEAGEDDGMEDEYGNRIESASPPHWGAGGHPDSRAERGMSPGAESNVSEGTSKRRRVKSSRKNSSASQGGSSTPNLTFSPSSTRRSSASNSEQPEEEETLFHQGTTTISSTLNDGAFSSSRSSYGHPHSGTSQATRRNRHQHRQSTSRPSSAAHTPNFSYTPLPSEMQRNFSSHSGGGR